MCKQGNRPTPRGTTATYRVWGLPVSDLSSSCRSVPRVPFVPGSHCQSQAAARAYIARHSFSQGPTLCPPLGQYLHSLALPGLPGQAGGRAGGVGGNAFIFSPLLLIPCTERCPAPPLHSLSVFGTFVPVHLTKGGRAKSSLGAAQCAVTGSPFFHVVLYSPGRCLHSPAPPGLPVCLSMGIQAFHPWT